MSFDSGSVIIEDGLKKYMISVFNRMFLALGLSGAVAFVCISSPLMLKLFSGGMSILFMLATIGICMYLSTRIQKISVEKARALFWIYAVLLGAWLSPIVTIYTHSSVANAFFVAACFFGIMSLYGYTTKKDLTSLGSFAFVGLVTLMITTLVNMFLFRSSLLQLGISAIFILIFCALTANNVQKIKQFYLISADDADVALKMSVIGALTLYLNFVNLFLLLLNFLGMRKQ